LASASKPFASYVLLAKRLAAGGLGVVFRASGEILRPDVAHKLPETDPLIDKLMSVANILRETRAACPTMPLSLFGDPADNNSSFKR